MSINQPALPHAIVAINATDINVNEDEWDVETATTRLLNSVRHALDQPLGVPEFINLANMWKNRGRKIRAVKDLIRCYYSSFHVVRLPAKGRYELLSRQIDQLHRTIVQCCELTYEAKRQARLLLTADTLNIYLQSAFDHFCLRLDRPFNFIDASLKVNPIPLDFGGHILQLAKAVHVAFDSNADGPFIFERLSSMVASCVLLDVVRNRGGKLV